MAVSEKKEKQLLKDMESLGISENDIEETFIRSSGPGGQKTNKSSTCVHLKHKPTGTIIKCQKTRNQAANRYYARKILVNKIEEKVKGEKSRERQRIEKIRRQKRKRSKRTKEKILADKHKQSEKKELRKKIVTVHD